MLNDTELLFEHILCIVRYVATLLIQVDSYELLTADVRMRHKDISYGIYGEKTGTETRFPPCTFLPSLIIILSRFHIYLYFTREMKN
jgi:hypothetical protein